MSLDDGPEVMSPRAAAALERGDDPQIDHFRSLTDYLAVSSDIAPSVYEKQARRLVSVASGVVEALAHLAAPARGPVLQQQRRADLSDEDWWLEEAAYHRKALDEAERILRLMRAGHVDRHDPDDARAQEDTDRINQERAAEKSQDVPRIAS